MIVRDTATGMVYDIRNQDYLSMLCQANEMLTKLPCSKGKKPWEEWWHEKREHNYELLNAAERGDKEKIIDLLDDKKYGDLVADTQSKGLDDFTPLHFAVSEGQNAAVEYLINRGANLEAVTTSVRTPLHIACNRGNQSIMEILVKAGANLNAQDKDGNTPAHILSNGGWVDALRWFLSKNPDLTIKNSYGETCMETAANLEIRQVFSLYTKVPENDSAYSRTVMEGVILHNNRADMVKSFMFKAQLLGAQSSSSSAPMPAKPETAPKPEEKSSPTSANPKKNSRVIKILDLMGKMKSGPSEEIKGESAPKDQKGDSPTSPPKIIS